MTKTNEANRPMRVLDKVLGGGLGPGNLGVVMARHGTGKLAVLTSIVIDHAMNGVNCLHVAVGKDISEVRAYDDEVLNEICKHFDLQDRAGIATTVERHKQIYTFRDLAQFTRQRLDQTLGFLAEHAQFRPALVEIEGWPDFRSLTEDEIRALKALARKWECEVWMTAHTHRDDEGLDGRGVPGHLARFDPYLSVIMAMEPQGDRVPIRFVKVHDHPAPQGINLDFDPQAMLIRWH